MPELGSIREWPGEISHELFHRGLLVRFSRRFRLLLIE